MVRLTDCPNMTLDVYHGRHVMSLLIHAFLSVNAQLLIAFGTAFYAIIKVICRYFLYV